MVTGSGEKRFHDQISWLMFLFSIFVIWVHSYNVDLFSGGARDGIWSLADRIEKFVSVGLGQIAVPGFFLLSSYLFFRNFSWGKLTGKWKSRIFSVLIPYVVWNIIYYLGYMAASRFFAIRSVVGRDIIPFSVQEIWRAVSQYAYAPIFWYLYQLIFLIIVSPLIYALVKNRAIGLLWIVGLVFAVHRRGLVERSMEEEAAGWKEDHGTKEKKAAPEDKDGNTASVIPDHVRRRCFAEGLAGVMISVFCYRRMMAPEAAVLWTCFYRMAVPMTCWAFACGVRLPKIRPWMRQSMFLYAIHYIVVRFVNKGIAVAARQLAGSVSAAGIALIVYFLLPAIAVMVSYILAKFLVRFLPGVWRVLSGGRKLEG